MSAYLIQDLRIAKQRAIDCGAVSVGLRIGALITELEWRAKQASVLTEGER